MYIDICICIYIHINRLPDSVSGAGCDDVNSGPNPANSGMAFNNSPYIAAPVSFFFVGETPMSAAPPPEVRRQICQKIGLDICKNTYLYTYMYIYTYVCIHLRVCECVPMCVYANE